MEELVGPGRRAASSLQISWTSSQDLWRPGHPTALGLRCGAGAVLSSWHTTPASGVLPPCSPLWGMTAAPWALQSPWDPFPGEGFCAMEVPTVAAGVESTQCCLHPRAPSCQHSPTSRAGQRGLPGRRVFSSSAGLSSSTMKGLQPCRHAQLVSEDGQSPFWAGFKIHR